jgi:beta-barrel assembly-enhancing protease
MRRSRLVLAAILALFAAFFYFGHRDVNPITGETQHIALTSDQEIALGLESAPQMADEFGGLDPDANVQTAVQSVGEHVVDRSDAAQTPYRFQFHVLADPQTVNAFALPGGPVFVTRGLLTRLENEAELAGVLGHEVGHVVARHSAAQIAKGQFAQQLVSAFGVATSDPYGPNRQAEAAASVVARMLQLKYGRGDELQADSLGVRFMSEAGYDPRALVEVMRILERASGGASGQPEWMSTHPDPGNRAQRIDEAIRHRFPGGVPANLTLGSRIVLQPEPAP